MTAAELIAKLRDFPPNATVMIEWPVDDPDEPDVPFQTSGDVNQIYLYENQIHISNFLPADEGEGVESLDDDSSPTT